MHIEKTLILIKPEAIHRHLIGEIITRFEQRGLKLAAIRLVIADADRVSRHYSEENNWELTGSRTLEGYEKSGNGVSGSPVEGKTPLEVGMWVREKLMKSMVGQPIVAMVWQGVGAIAVGRKIVGHTNPMQADMGTIRGDFSHDSYEIGDTLERPVRNLVHASSNAEEVAREIPVWFSDEEVCSYSRATDTVFYGSSWE